MCPHIQIDCHIVSHHNPHTCQYHMHSSTVVRECPIPRLCWRHSIELVRIIDGRHILRALRCIKLCAPFHVVNNASIIDYACLDHAHPAFTSKSIPETEECGSTIAAEAAGDLLARVGDLRDLFWLARHHLELLRRNDNVL